MNSEYKPISNLWKDSKGYRYFGTLKLSSKIKYDGDDFIQLWEWVEQLQQENEQLQKQITVMKEYLGLIIDLSFDYDGCNTVESLKSLIDDLKKYAKLGREGNLTEPIYTNDNDSYNILNQKIRKDSTNE